MTVNMAAARPPSSGEEGAVLHSKYSKDLEMHVTIALRGGRIASVSLSDKEPPGTRRGGHPFLDRVIEHLATGRDDLRDLPVDLPAPGFEREVLEAMRAIPPGEVVTYGELARRVGRPGAGRAVGNACARNRAIIVVPCHRVVPSSGGVGNYSGPGGARLKSMLLEKEGALENVKGGLGRDD